MRCKTLAILGIVALLANGALAQVNVTFRLNTSTVYANDITDESMVQVRGSIAPITWGDDSVDMVNQEGDVWEIVVTFDASEVGNTLDYKFYAEDWESTDNKQLVLDQDVVLDLAYFNQGYTPPYAETADIDLWIRVNMRSKVPFDPEADEVGIRGGTAAAGVDIGNLSWGTSVVLSREEESDYFSGQLMLPADSTGIDISYKFVAGAGPDWESIDNRVLTIPTDDMTVGWAWWNNEEAAAEIDTGTVIWQADMSDFLGDGSFDPATEWISIRGGFEGWSNEDPMIPDLIDPTLYKWSYEVIAGLGSEIEWKFKAFPDENWQNSGWENCDNHIFVFEGDVELPAIKPEILPLGDTLQVESTVRFTVDVSEAINFHTGEPFPSIESVWLAGDDGIGPLEWPAWSIDDTTSMVRLFDDGTNGGDQVAGDEIWTGEIVMPIGAPSNIIYKYGVYYPGLEDLGVTIPMDNEAGFALNHIGMLQTDVAFQELPTDIFGSQPVYEIEGAPIPEVAVLGNNWPNPFSERTIFRYDLPKSGQVELAVYDLTGRKVCSVFSGEQNAGVYLGSWNARDENNRPVSSGTYLLRLDSRQGFAEKRIVVLR